MIKWIGTITTIISSLVISISPQLSTYPAAFAGYFVGAAFWLCYALRIKDYPLGVLNCFYLLINSFAIYIRL